MFTRLFILTLAGLAAPALACLDLTKLCLPAGREDLSALDSKLKTHLETMMEGANRFRRAALARVLANFESAAIGDLSPTNLASTRTNVRGTHLVIQERLLNHPYGRVIVAHESRHILNAVRFGSLPLVSLHYGAGILLWPGGLRAEEKAAWKSQYDFIREAYSQADLPRLKKRYSTTVSKKSLALLEAETLWSKERGLTLNEEILKTLPEKPALKKAVDEYLDVNLNEMFLADVEAALSKPFPAYFESAYEAYLGQEKVNKFRRLIVAGGIAYLASDLFGGDDSSEPTPTPTPPPLEQ